MICSEQMSNKFDFNKVTFKICSSNCLEYLATTEGQLSPPQLQGAAQDPTSGSTSSAIVRAQVPIYQKCHSQSPSAGLPSAIVRAQVPVYQVP